MLNLCQFLVNRVFRGQVETDSFQNLCLDFGILLCRLVDRAESIKFPEADRVDLIELGHQEKDGCSDQLEFLVGKGHFEGEQFVEEKNIALVVGAAGQRHRPQGLRRKADIRQ